MFQACRRVSRQNSWYARAARSRIKNSRVNGVDEVRVASYIPKHLAFFMRRLPALRAVLHISFHPSPLYTFFCRFVLARIWNLKRELLEAFEELSRFVAFHVTFRDIPLIFPRPIEHGIVQRLWKFIANLFASSFFPLRSSRETYH